MSQESVDSVNYFEENPKWFMEKVKPPTHLWAHHFSLPKEKRNRLFNRVLSEECKVMQSVYSFLTKSQITEKTMKKFGIPNIRGKVLRSFVDDYKKSEMTKNQTKRQDAANNNNNNVLKRKNEDSEMGGIKKKCKTNENIHVRIANVQYRKKSGMLSVKELLRYCTKFQGKKYEQAMISNKYLLGDYTKDKSNKCPTSMAVTSKNVHGECFKATKQNDSESVENDDKELNICSQLAQSGSSPQVVFDSDESVNYSEDEEDALEELPPPPNVEECESFTVLDEDSFSSDSFDSEEFCRREPCSYHDAEDAEKKLGNILLTGSDSESIHSSDIEEDSEL